MLVVLLSSLLALWAFRASLVNETIVGNDADYQRAFEAAQAMLQDAELDIRGERGDGTDCVPTADVKVCRKGGTMAFIEETRQIGGFIFALDTQTTRCRDGICQKRTGAQDFWATDAVLNPMKLDAARYGEYTGARLPADSKASANPILAWNDADQRTAANAWYWIEVMPYDNSPAGLLAGRDKLDLNLNPNVVYRITAIARGLKPSTQVVLQSTLARQKLRN